MLGTTLRHLAGAAGRPALGLGGPCITGAAATCSSVGSSSTALWLRGFAGDAGNADKPAEEAAAAPAEGAAAAAAAESGEPGEGTAAEPEEPAPVHPSLIDFHDGSDVPAELFTKRQLAWMGVEQPERYRRFLPQLSRKELGSFADEYVDEEFDVEADLYPEYPEDKPLYDLRTDVPEIYEPASPLLERLQRLKLSYPDMPLEQFAREVVGIEATEDEPPRPDAQRIIRWQIQHTYVVGVNEGHPSNKNVKAWVYLRDLQREHGLTDAALQHIAAVCGPRYNPNKGLLKLTEARYVHREANRARIMKIIADLVAEGHRKFPAPQQQQQQQPEEQQQQQQQDAAA